MRRFIRHPTGMPIDYSIAGHTSPQRDPLRNVAQGGLCFQSDAGLDPGTRIHVTIPVRQPPFEADATVVWSRMQHNHFEIGVKFDQRASRFALRMVEQICHIEQYRQEVRNRENRELTREQAAEEWIAKYANRFPSTR